MSIKCTHHDVRPNASSHEKTMMKTFFFKPYVTRNLFNVRDLKVELSFKWNDIFKFCLNFYGIQNKNQPHQSVHNKWIKWCLFVILLSLRHHLLINVTLYFHHLRCSSPSSPAGDTIRISTIWCYKNQPHPNWKFFIWFIFHSLFHRNNIHRHCVLDKGLLACREFFLHAESFLTCKRLFWPSN